MDVRRIGMATIGGGPSAGGPPLYASGGAETLMAAGPRSVVHAFGAGSSGRR